MERHGASAAPERIVGGTRPDPGEPPQLVNAEEAEDGDDHDRAERRLGQVLEQEGEKRASEQGQAGRHQRRKLRATSAALDGHRLAGAARLDEPRGETRQQVRAAEGDQVAVDVHAVPVRRGQRTGDTDRFGAEQEDAERRWQEIDGVAPGDVGPRRIRNRGRQLADDGDAVAREVERRRGRDREHEDEQRAGHARREPAESH